MGWPGHSSSEVWLTEESWWGAGRLNKQTGLCGTFKGRWSEKEEPDSKDLDEADPPTRPARPAPPDQEGLRERTHLLWSS